MWTLRERLSPRLRVMARLWHRPAVRFAFGPALTLLVIAAHEIAAHAAGIYTTSVGAAVLFVVLIATTLGGWFSGLVSALLGVAYSIYFYILHDGPWVHPLSAIRLMEFSGILLLTLVGIHMLRRRIIEQARTEAGRRSDQRLRQVLDNLATFVGLLTPDGTLIEANEAPLRAAGITIDDVRGRKFWGCPWWNDDESVRRQVRDACRRAADGEVVRYDVPVRMAGDTRRIIDFQIAPLRDEQGRITHLIPSAVDITERKQAEQALAQQMQEVELEHRRLRAVLDALPVAVFIADRDGRLLELNAAAREIWGGEPPLLESPEAYEAYRARWPDAGKPVEAQEWGMYRVIRYGEVVTAEEMEITTFDGQHKTILNYALPIRDARGEVVGGVAVNVDITARRATERELEALTATLERRVAQRTEEAEHRAVQLRHFAAELTQVEQCERRRLAQVLHDHLQQLLAAAKLRLGMLAVTVDDEAVQREVRAVEEYVGESIEASRSLTIELSPPILYDAGLSAGLEWLARWAREHHGLTVHVDADPAAEPENEDLRMLLFQAARELLFNVVKHARTDEAWVTLAREDEGQAGTGDEAGTGGEAGDDRGGEAAAGPRVRVTIEDRGHGFDLASRLKAGQGGFGLLSIRERLELLGGRFEIHSAPGKGTRATLWAPVRRSADVDEPLSLVNVKENARGELSRRLDGELAPTAVEHPRAVEGDASGDRRIRVLIADDHRILREGVASLLRNEPDIEVIAEAADGRDAVNLAHRMRPDVVVMDITMPRLNGVEATRRLRRELPEVAVIGLSIHERQDMADAMQHAGACAYLTKGGPADVLLREIRRCARRAA